MGILRYVPAGAKRAVKQALGVELSYRPCTPTPRQMHGVNDGLWCVCPEGLDERAVVYSVGVGLDVSFDLSLIETFGVTLHAFDPTPRSIAWIAGQTLPEEFRFHPFGLADFDGTVRFRPPLNPANVSHTMLARPLTDEQAIDVPVRRLSTVMRQLGHGRIDLLKLDIEGAEYGVIDDLATTTIRPRQLLVEFHHRFPGVGPRRTQYAIRLLRRLGYEMFHASSEQMEFGFLWQGEVGRAAA